MAVLHQMQMAVVAAQAALDDMDAKGGGNIRFGEASVLRMFGESLEKQRLTRAPKARPDFSDSAWGRMLSNEETRRDAGSKEAIDSKNRFRVPYNLFGEPARVIDGRARGNYDTD